MLKPISSTIIFTPTAAINKVNSQNMKVKPTVHQLLLDAKKNLLNFDILNMNDAKNLNMKAVALPLNIGDGKLSINQDLPSK